MIATVLLWLQVATAPAGAAGAVPAPMPPADWSALPPPRWHRIPGPSDVDVLSRFAESEVATGRCVRPDLPAPLDLAVLVSPKGEVRRIVPRAINCPTVEQFASGLISRLMRGNLVGDPAGERWHRVSLDLRWSG